MSIKAKNSFHFHNPKFLYHQIITPNTIILIFLYYLIINLFFIIYIYF